ncbi:MAG: calcium-binding protein [Kiritimatiellae bacterium]|nr:calcium-binding protein [Kiritimatiellia bacterium]
MKRIRLGVVLRGNKFRLLFLALMVLTGHTPAMGKALPPGEVVECRELVFFPDRWDEKGISTKLTPWEGKHIVFLTKQTELDPEVMGLFVERLDAGWEHYADLIQRSPVELKKLNGKTTITALPHIGLSCGIGCGYIGASGVEVAGFYNHDYPMAVKNNKQFSHYYFYEMGRNYYVFDNRHSLFITGFAVFMRYICMDALGCEDPDLKTRKTIEECEALYATSNISFLQAFTNLSGDPNEKANRLKRDGGERVDPSDQPVMYATAMLKLYQDCGGDPWLKRFYAALHQCPQVKPDSRESALKQSLNWLVSASIAAKKDLTPVFVERWRMPLAERTRKALAEVDWKESDLNPETIIRELPVEFINAQEVAAPAEKLVAIE